MQTLFIEPGSPWENGYVESFNGKLRDELLDREIFYTLTEAQIFYTLTEAQILMASDGGGSTTRCDRTVRWAIDPQRPRRSCRHRLAG